MVNRAASHLRGTPNFDRHEGLPAVKSPTVKLEDPLKLKTDTKHFLPAVIAVGLLAACTAIPPGNTECPSGYPYASCPQDYRCIETEPGCEMDIQEVESCASHDYSICSDTIAYWYDSCGNLQGIREECTDTECFGGECLEPACDDGNQNGQETDSDCGGGCSPCPEGGGCLVDADCASYLCEAGSCAASSCSDGVTNGGETDVDCGGPACNGCGLNFNCLEDSDCDSGTCQNGACVMSFCNDGTQNGSESDVDCGGVDCSGCEGGQSCSADSDCLSQSCAGGACTEFECPSDMVRVGTRAVCIDKYEASVYANADCSGTQYGIGSADDYPSGFPDNVASTGCEGECQGATVVAGTTEVYACSLLGERPSANLTFFQARRACEVSGKYLCKLPSDWLYSCQNGNGDEYPYGDVYNQAQCNDGWHGQGRSLNTGSMTQCHGTGFATPIFDMSGNVWEWTDSCIGSGQCFQAGGGYSDINDYLQCDHSLAAPALDGNPFTGFRCCFQP